MTVDRLKDVEAYYDVVVIGSGLGGLTAANYLGKLGYKVLLLEHHYQYGGLASWFRRKFKNIFDISLHGFPVGMIKSCRKYWTKEIADSIVQLKDIRFVNPDFKVSTSFDRSDFTRILIEVFKVERSWVERFFDHVSKMNFYDRDNRTTGEMFEEFFPRRADIHRFLMEPIAYANGSTLEDPAITYGIVFSNFMSKGVYVFKGGTNVLIGKMIQELNINGVDTRKLCLVEKILIETEEGMPIVRGIVVNEKEIRCGCVVSNAGLKNTLFDLLGEEHLPEDFAEEGKAVKVNSSSCQVYIGIKKGETIPPIGDLVFTSQARPFSGKELVDLKTTSRTFSVYYPEMRPQEEQCAIVASLNAQWEDWSKLGEADYLWHKNRICEESLQALECFVPDIRLKVNWLEAATPRTIHRYTRHLGGSSFGTKFEGLKVSMELPEKVHGLYHAGSVGIIMSGWLGTINYGVIIANKVDKFLEMKKMKV